MLKERTVRLDHNLGQSIMIPQINKQQASMVPFTKHPTGQTHFLSCLFTPQFTASMCPITMHDRSCPIP